MVTAHLRNGHCDPAHLPASWLLDRGHRPGLVVGMLAIWGVPDTEVIGWLRAHLRDTTWSADDDTSWELSGLLLDLEEHAAVT